MKVYNAAVKPSLQQRHINTLTAVQLSHLRILLGSSWEDKKPNTEVFQMAETLSIEAKAASQLRWSGHIYRMPEHWLPKQILYGDFTSGKGVARSYESKTPSSKT